MREQQPNSGDSQERPSMAGATQSPSAHGLLALDAEVTWTIDFVGAHTGYGVNAEAVCGYSNEELARGGLALWLDLVHPEDVECVRRSFDSLFSEGVLFDLVYRLRAKDGEWIWLRDRALAVCNKQGARVACGSFFDITRCRRAEEELRRKDAILEAVASIAERLAKTSSCKGEFLEIAALLGRATNVDRAYVVEGHPAADGAMLVSERCRWVTNGVDAGLGVSPFNNLRVVESGFGAWLDAMHANRAICVNVRELPDQERSLFAIRRIKSLALFPIFCGRRLWGLIGFDQCSEERDWSRGEIEALKAAAGILGSALERERTEMALRASEERCRAHYMKIPVPTFTWQRNGDDLVLVDHNEAAFEVTRGAVSRAIGATARDMFSENTYIVERLWHAMNEQTAIKEEVLYRFPGEKDNKNLVVTCVFVPPDSVVVHTEDVTEHRRAEQALSTSEELYRKIVETSLEGMWLVDYKGRTTFVNRRMADILGYDLSEMVGRSALEFADGPSREVMKRMFKRRRRGLSDQYDCCWLHRDGSEVHAINSASPIIDHNGQFAGSLLMVSDVTARKQAEEEAQLKHEQLMQADKMISLGVLVSGVAHEISNPNHLVLSNITLLKDAFAALSPMLDKYGEHNGDFVLGGLNYSEMRTQLPQLISEIQDASRRINKFITELRNFAPQTPEDYQEHVDINNVVDSAVTLTRSLIAKSTESFELELDSDVPVTTGNFQQLEQVVVNLVINACQALRAREQGVRVSTSYHPDDRTVAISVRDEGVGMDEEALRRAIDPFFTTKRQKGGMGLGLAISARIVKRHEGRIQFDSTPGKGTCVKIVIPVKTG